MKITTVTGSITDIKVDVAIVNLFEGITTPGGATGAVDQALDRLISQSIALEGFEGKLGQVLELHTHGKIPARKALIVGLGPSDRLTVEAIRRASAAAVAKAAQSGASSAATILHGAGIGGMNPAVCAQATIEGAVIGSYRFDNFKSDPDSKQLTEFVVVEYDADKSLRAAAGVVRGEAVANAVNSARDLINTPANYINPSSLADYAEELAERCGLECKVLEEADVERLGMQAYLAVASGSQQSPKFITLRYRPENASGRTVAIIGKGITFDSGGLSLKSAEGMMTMKDDMSGAAAVLSAMEAVTRLGSPHNILALVPAAENMPSGAAMRPGDVVKAMNGKTIEIENTDAEGRLTLADALCYAVEQGADEIIDIATLTGACVVALGRGAAGLFTNDDSLKARLLESSERSGDILWPLPLLDDYFDLIKSEVADMKNTGGREGGATTAALLLREFCGNRPWAHIDIAGPAFLDKPTGIYGKGGTGMGVRLLLDYLCPVAAS